MGLEHDRPAGFDVREATIEVLGVHVPALEIATRQSFYARSADKVIEIPRK
jgi:hypothetical protein